MSLTPLLSLFRKETGMLSDTEQETCTAGDPSLQLLSDSLQPQLLPLLLHLSSPILTLVRSSSGLLLRQTMEEL